MTYASLHDQVFPALSGEAVNHHRRQRCGPAGLISQLIGLEYLHESAVRVAEKIGAGRAHGPNLDQAILVDVGSRRADYDSVRILLHSPSGWRRKNIF